MPCGGAGNAKTVDLSLLPPVQLDDLSHTPAPNVGAQLQRNDPRRVRMGAGEMFRRRLVEVIVMVVREKHDVEGRERVDRQRRFHDPSWSHPLHRERALAEDGIGEDVQATQLEQNS